MKQTYALAALLSLAITAVPAIASAHEQRTVSIKNVPYQFTVGSLNEPVIVDDKTGVDLTVKKLDTASAVSGDMSQMIHLADGTMLTAGAPVLDLEKFLQVELKADGQSKTLPFTAVYGAPGKYKAVFYPTASTTYTYRIFGTLDGTPVDLSFTCSTAGHAMVTDMVTKDEKVSDEVTILTEKGAFGCPADKPRLGFPDRAASLKELSSASTPFANWIGALGVALGLLALLRRNPNR